MCHELCWLGKACWSQIKGLKVVWQFVDGSLFLALLARFCGAQAQLRLTQWRRLVLKGRITDGVVVLRLSCARVIPARFRAHM